jgi:hypothetical protein
MFASISQTIRKSIFEVSQCKLLKLETGPYQHEFGAGTTGSGRPNSHFRVATMADIRDFTIR